MRNRNLLFLIIIFYFFSCSKSEEFQSTRIKEIKIDLNQTANFNFSDFFDTTLIVPLEVSDFSLLGEASKVITTDNLIFVLDKPYSESLYAFDYNGKLVHFFSGTGDGPGEFVRVTNFYLSKSADTIFIQDNSLPKILAFNQSGELLLEKNLRDQANISDLIPHNDGYLMMSPNTEKLGMDLSILDSKLDFESKPIEFRENDFLLASGAKDQFFYPGSKGNVFFKEALSKDLYSLNSGEIEAYSLEFPSNRVFSMSGMIWDDSKPSIHMAYLMREIKNNNYLNLGDQILNLGDHLFINYYIGDRLGFLVLNQKTNEVNIVSEFKNDLDGVVENLPGIHPTNFQADQMTISLTPTEIFSMINGRRGINPYQDYLVEILPELEENPVLFIYR